MANVEKFKYWCNKILPLVYDDSLSYYEFLGKVYEKLNETIDAVNSNTEAVAEFDQRINDFIAAETAARESWEDQQERDRQSWETTETANRTAWENQQALKWSAFQSMFIAEYDPDDAYVQGDLCSMQYKMYVAKASTTGTFDPTKWDEIVLSDYLAQFIDGAAADLQAQYDEFLETYQREFGVTQNFGDSTTDAVSQKMLTELFVSVNSSETINWTDNTYITPSGTVGSSTSFASTDYIPLDNIAVIYCNLIDSARIAIYKANKKFISAIGPGSTNLHVLPLINEAKYVRFCTRKSVIAQENCVLYSNRIHSKFYAESKTALGLLNTFNTDFQKTTITWIDGEYVSYSDGTTASTTGFSRSDYIPIKNAQYIITQLQDRAGIAVYDKNYTYLEGVQGTVVNGSYYHVYSVPFNSDAAYVRFSNRTEIIDKSDVYVITSDAWKYRYDMIPKATPINILCSYNKIVCAGDSLTYGQVYTGENTSRAARSNYPQTIQKLIGTETETQAVAGYTATQWWNEYKNSYIQNGLYIFYLGTNAGLTDTVTTDCAGDDPSNYADTHTGNYGKAIATALSNGNRAVLVKVKQTSGTLTTTNKAITDLATKFGLPLITAAIYGSSDEIYHKWPNGEGVNTVHYNDYGYTFLATKIIEQINNLSDEDKEKMLTKN